MSYESRKKKHRRYRKGPIFCKYTWQYKKDNGNSFSLSCIPVTYACLSFLQSWNDLCLCGIFINIFQLLEPAKARKQRERWEEKRRARKEKEEKLKEERKKKSERAQGKIKWFKKGRKKVKRRYELTNNKKAMNINQMMRSNEEINEIEKY